MDRLKNLAKLPEMVRKLVSTHPLIGFLVILGYLVFFGSLILECAGVISEPVSLIIQSPAIIMFIVMYIYSSRE